jgi:hypothetical protein
MRNAQEQFDTKMHVNHRQIAEAAQAGVYPRKASYSLRGGETERWYIPRWLQGMANTPPPPHLE